MKSVAFVRTRCNSNNAFTTSSIFGVFFCQLDRFFSIQIQHGNSSDCIWLCKWVSSSDQVNHVKVIQPGDKLKAFDSSPSPLNRVESGRRETTEKFIFSSNRSQNEFLKTNGWKRLIKRTKSDAGSVENGGKGRPERPNTKWKTRSNQVQQNWDVVRREEATKSLHDAADAQLQTTRRMNILLLKCASAAAGRIDDAGLSVFICFNCGRNGEKQLQFQLVSGFSSWLTTFPSAWQMTLFSLHFPSALETLTMWK